MGMAIKRHAPPKSKTEIAKELGVSRSSLYYCPRLPMKDYQLKTAIEQVMAEHKAYGHRRIAIELGVNKKRINRVMKLFGLKVQRHRRKPRKSRDIGQPDFQVPNILQNTVVSHPGQVLASDFTYLPYQERFVYLATFEDIFTREIVGWSVSLRHTTSFIIEALEMALGSCPNPELVHSDQGSEYRSKAYCQSLKCRQIKLSMSAKGSPWQNGYQESFYSEFKLELGHPDAYPDLGELIEAIASQIHYYNYRRIHSALKCPPAVFHQKNRLNAVVDNTFINKSAPTPTLRLAV